MQRKTLTIIFIIIILLAAFGVGAFFYFMKVDIGDFGIGDKPIFEGFFSTDRPDEAEPPLGGAAPDGNQLREPILLGKEEELPKLRKIADGPIAGAVIFENDGVNIIRYVERKTGHIYELKATDDRAKRITNTTIPRVKESIWSKDGSNVIIRYQDEETNKISTFAGTINEEKNELSGEFLTEDIIAISPSEETNRLLLVLDSGDGAIGYSAGFDGRDRVRIFETSFSEWVASWPQAATVALFTKPSAVAKGYLYFVNTKNGVFEKKLSGIDGLTALVGPSAKNILYSKSVKNGLETYLSDELLLIKTFSDKCAFDKNGDSAYCGAPQIIPKGEYPDDWYQGKISFNDDIWKIDRETGFVDLIISPSDIVFEDIDLINLVISSDNKYLIFTNKKDQGLWLLELI